MAVYHLEMAARPGLDYQWLKTIKLFRLGIGALDELANIAQELRHL